MTPKAFELHNLEGAPFTLSPEDITVLFKHYPGHDKAGSVIMLQNGAILGILETYAEATTLISRALYS